MLVEPPGDRPLVLACLLIAGSSLLAWLSSQSFLPAIPLQALLMAGLTVTLLRGWPGRRLRSLLGLVMIWTLVIETALLLTGAVALALTTAASMLGGIMAGGLINGLITRFAPQKPAKTRTQTRNQARTQTHGDRRRQPGRRPRGVPERREQCRRNDARRSTDIKVAGPAKNHDRDEPVLPD